MRRNIFLSFSKRFQFRYNFEFVRVLHVNIRQVCAAFLLNIDAKEKGVSGFSLMCFLLSEFFFGPFFFFSRSITY